MSDVPAVEAAVPVAGGDHGHGSRGRRQLFGLALASLGVVFGDIGTSPLYAVRECLSRAHGLSSAPENVFGIVSLIFWALMVVISLKYVAYVLRADNGGEGGMLALTALATAKAGRIRPRASAGPCRRPVRRGTPVRGRHHHPRDLRAQRRRGLEVGNACLRTAHLTARELDSLALVLDAATRHRQCGRRVRAGDVALVLHAGCAGH